MQRSVAQGIRNEQRQRYEAQAVVVGSLAPAVPLEVFSAQLPDAVRRYRHTMWAFASLEMLFAAVMVYSAWGLPGAPFRSLAGDNVTSFVAVIAAWCAFRVGTTYVVRRPWSRALILVSLLLQMVNPLYWLVAAPLFVEVLQPRVASWFEVRREVVRALI